MSQRDALVRHLLAQQERAATLEAELTALPALGPENGGEGEAEKAAFIEGLLAACKVADVRRVDSPDPRVASGMRPNVVARVAGESPRTLWIFGHMDVVPAGDPAAWGSDPWRVRREGDLIYGRGVEDNQQAVTCMLLLAEALSALGIRPRQSLGLVFMADEECGSRHGLAHVLETAPELFGPDDWYLVPDSGSARGDAVEMAEKAQLWLKVTTGGRQCHASTPHKGRNAFLAGAEAAVALHDGLALAFPERDSLFRPPVSTFEPTRHEPNVEAVNILPGRDVFYLDCRLLPAVSAEAVLARGREIAAEVAARRDVSIEIAVEHVQPSSMTRPDLPVDAPLFPALADAVEAVYDVRPRPVGIGGATVAALLRARGLAAVVWSRIFNTCHQPDERASLAHICGDAAVFGHLLMAHAVKPGPAHA
ncbi:MAG: M20 family metallo-hydrolase [Desulfovibrio sp.]|nr:M20 family metallo-hydrolase [Desulfovibrio sp.]